MRLPPRIAGFSLVEVVLAVGLIAFCCIAMLGLLTVGYDAAKASTDDSRNALLYEDIVRQFQLKPFASSTTQIPQPVEGSTILPLPLLGGSNANGTDYPVASTTSFMVDQNFAYTSNVGAADRFVTVTVSNPPDLHLDETSITGAPNPEGLAQVSVVISFPPAIAQAALGRSGSGAVVTSSTFVTEIGSWEDQSYEE